MKITISYEVGDKVLFKAPAGPMKFTDVVGIIEDITFHFDEVSDSSYTVYVMNVNGGQTRYNISYPQILKIVPDENHTHDFEEMCMTCGKQAHDD